MSLGGRRASQIMISIVAAILVAGCYTRRVHDFSAEIQVTPAVRIVVETSGFSTTEADGSETAGPIYLFAFRISGTGTQVELSGVKVVDPATGFEVRVETFQPPVRDPSDSTMLIIDRSGIPLSPSPKQISGELRIGQGADLEVIPFSGMLLYEYREERRNRLWDAINSA